MWPFKKKQPKKYKLGKKYCVYCGARNIIKEGLFNETTGKRTYYEDCRFYHDLGF